jgi:lipopolysaccharide export LptBFGC system permease protein LptF
MAKSDEEYSRQAMRGAVIAVAVSGAALAVLGFALFNARVGLGVILGGALATANLYVFAKLGDAFLGQKGNAAPWALIALVKLVFLFGGVWIILKNDFVPGLALAAGYGALPIGITFGFLFGPKPPDDDTETLKK